MLRIQFESQMSPFGGRRSRSRSKTEVKEADEKKEYKAIGFTTFECTEPVVGERIKIETGDVGKRKTRTTYVIPKLFPQSDLIVITHKRPIGLVAVPDTDGRIRVAELMEGSWSAQAAALARLSQAGALTAAAPGDVLRAYTFTVFEFQARASLLGDLSGAKRAISFFGADDQPWEKAFGALAQGAVADGEVTIVLERAKEGTQGSYWRPLPARRSAAEEAAEAAEAAAAASRRLAAWEAATAAETSGRDQAALRPPPPSPAPESSRSSAGISASALERVLGQTADTSSADDRRTPGGGGCGQGQASGAPSDRELEWAAALRAEDERVAEEKRAEEQEELQRARFSPEGGDSGLNIAVVGLLGTLGLLLFAGFFP